MNIAILPIGLADLNILRDIQKGLCEAFQTTKCAIVKDVMPLPENGYNAGRQQYDSTILLRRVRQFARKSEADRTLGVTDVDLYAFGLNFVFGEAESSGRAAIISLHRLRPTFYGRPPNRLLFVERAVKEAVHEIGHTLGLKHCINRRCVMSFSNSILDTDRKQSVFCEKCYLVVLAGLGER